MKTHHWDRCIYALGYEAQNGYSALKCYLPFLPPADPEEMEKQNVIKSQLEVYRYLSWLFVNEVRMLKDLDHIARQFHQS